MAESAGAEGVRFLWQGTGLPNNEGGEGLRDGYPGHTEPPFH
jgi:hypothetical protein